MIDEQEQIKERTGWIITFLAAFLAITSLLDGGNSAQILDNTIEANNVWSFYQAKSIKQSLAEMRYDDAIRAGDKKKAQIMKAKIERYESEPETGEGKKELMAKAKAIEEERAVAESRSPWYTYSNAFYQIAIVILAASMLTFSKRMYWIGIGLGAFAILLMFQGALLLIPITL
jgi:hypothetical protein